MPENTTPTPSEEKVEMRTPSDFSTQHHSHVGPILGVLVIMLALILGGLFLWGSMIDTQIETPIEEPIVNNEPETTRANVDTQILETTSPSDSLEAIEADVTGTDLNSLETDLNAIDAELNAAIPD